MIKIYEDWYKELNDLCWRHAGCSVDDLVDFNSFDLYESGLSPMEALRENDEVSDLLDEETDE